MMITGLVMAGFAGTLTTAIVYVLRGFFGTRRRWTDPRRTPETPLIPTRTEPTFEAWMDDGRDMTFDEYLEACEAYRKTMEVQRRASRVLLPAPLTAVSARDWQAEQLVRAYHKKNAGREPWEDTREIYGRMS